MKGHHLAGLCLAFSAILPLALGGCFSRTDSPHRFGTQPKGEVAAQVGSYTITKADAEFRDQVIHAYYPDDKRHMGLHQLIEAYTMAQIMANHGRAVTDEQLANEEKRIAKESLMPDKLAEIQAIFNGDHDAYLKVYVLPTYVERVIYFDYFLKTPSIHQESYVRAKSFEISAAQHPAQFSEFAKKVGVTDSRFVVSMTNGIQWLYEDPKIPKELPQPPAGSPAEATVQGAIKSQAEQEGNQEAAAWIRDVATKLGKGDVFQKVVDAGESWRVVRYLGPRSKGEYLFEAAVFPKRAFGDWLNEEKAKVVVKER